MIFLYAFLVLLFVFCAVSSMPTRAWLAAGAWLQAARTRSARRAVARELARLTRRTPFTPETSFLPRGIGLAVDRTRRLIFVATREGKAAHGAILDLDRVTGSASGDAYHYGFEDHYVDLAVRDTAHPVWRLWCGEDAALAAEINRAIEAIRRDLRASAA